MKTCKEHPEEILMPCVICGKIICGICDHYINPITMIAITKKVWEEYPKSTKVIGRKWPKEPMVACLKCAKKHKMVD